MNDLKKFYTDNIDTYSAEIKKKKRKEVLMGLFKLSFIGFLLWFLYINNYYLATIMAIHFVVTLRIHEKVIRERKTFEALSKVNINERDALDYKYPFKQNGEEYIDNDHPYSSDLDIFGYHSLFHFINRGVTKAGREKLAAWFKSKADPATILKRQEAVKELKDRYDFRQKLMIQEDLRKKGSAKPEEGLDKLLGHAPFIMTSGFMIAVIHIIPLITLAAFVAIFFKVNYLWFVGLILVQMFFNMYYSNRVKEFFKKTGKVVSGISIYTGIIEVAEKEEFKSEIMKDLTAVLRSDSGSAYKRIRKLSDYIDNLELRRSSLHGLVNNMVFWDLNNILRAEIWLKKSGRNLPLWLDTCGEMEAVCSLAAFSFNTPSAVFPKISDKRYYFEAKDMGHPLLKEEERINNDFSMSEESKVMVITGPNMAGKSTFLRTAGINCIMALAGSVVTAGKLEVSHMTIYTSMKISDSLDKGISLFYAELRRLKDVTDASKSGEPVFFLIDEMLKGTNVIDRRKGSLALMNQLMDLKVSGIIATHDLTLAETPNPNVINTHFDSIVKGDELEFDYKLKEGICQSFNALVLMKKIGIPV